MKQIITIILLTIFTGRVIAQDRTDNSGADRVYALSGEYLNEYGYSCHFYLDREPTPQFKEYNILPLPYELSSKELKMLREIRAVYKPTTVEQNSEICVDSAPYEGDIITFVGSDGVEIDSLRIHSSEWSFDGFGLSFEPLEEEVKAKEVIDGKELTVIQLKIIGLTTSQFYDIRDLARHIKEFNNHTPLADTIFEYIEEYGDFNDFYNLLYSNQNNILFEFTENGGSHDTKTVKRLNDGTIELSEGEMVIDLSSEDDEYPNEYFEIYNRQRYSDQALKALVERYKKGRKQ